MKIATFSWDALTVTVAGRRIQLDITEAKVLRYLWLERQTVSMATLAKFAIGGGAKPNTAGVYVMRLRGLLGHDTISTVVGRGYRLQLGLRMAP